MVMGTELFCLEPKATAEAKLGQNEQWISVQDPSGDQGYVAAWYVSDTKGGATATTVGTSPSTPATVPATRLPPGALALVPTEELSFRTQPVIAPETLIRRIPPTEQVICLEPASQAIPKIGVTGQWLKVRDASNKEGYVAAWYVKYASGSTAQAEQVMANAAPSNGGPLKVRATVEGLALRKQPVVSDATLIKWLPLGTELVVTETNAAAKIGKSDQWLQVKDPTGTEGVVAAWFVAR